jgi:radical SAM superfamily enzyme YgiQ (UPF0313 family)
MTPNSTVRIILLQPISIFTYSFDFKNTIITHLLEIGTQVKHKFENMHNISVEVVNLIDEKIYKPPSFQQYDKFLISLENFLLRYNDQSHLIFGISCFSSNYYISTLALAKLIRKLYPKSLICVGGYQVNFFAEEFIFPRIIEGIECTVKLFDYVFLGESDYTFADIIWDRINRNRIVSDKSEECYVIQSGLVKNLNDLPLIDYALMRIPDSPFIFIPVYFSKGCPFNCTFCGDFRNIYKANERWRMVSPKNAVNRLENITKFYEDKSIQIQIFDPLWAYPDWRMHFYESLIKNKNSQEFWAEIRIDQFSLKEIQFLKDLNFTFAFGLESANHDMLRIMKKTNNTTLYLSRALKIFTEMDNAGIYVICNVLLGHPGENPTSITQTVDYINSMAEFSSNLIPSISKYMLIPGSEVFNNRSYYTQTYKSRFHYPHYWTIPKCSRISSSMVDPSKNMSYLDVITAISQWIPDLFTICIKQFTMKKERSFIHQRYLNQMIFGPRIYWKKDAIKEYNEYGKNQDVKTETEAFWKEIF